MTKKIGVVGAGVIGLSSALNILKQCEDVEVTIISEEFTPNTTTDVSAGFWDPLYLGGRGTDPELIKKWCKVTFEFMLDLVFSAHAKDAGAQLISGYTAFTYDYKEDYPTPDIFLGFREMTARELKLMSGCRKGFSYTTTIVEPGLYLKWLMAGFKEKGGKVIKKKVYSLNELADYDIIVNCTGMGARELLDDKEMYSTRGQVMKVHAPWIKHFMVRIGEHKEDYIFPGATSCVLGGVFQLDDWNVNVNEDDRHKIWRDCCEMMPSLKFSKVVKDVAALRPCREKIRLETERKMGSNRILRVIHNYGHGGAGVTLHWGCALDAVTLVQKELSSLRRTAKM